jgi:hypothetical protein
LLDFVAFPSQDGISRKQFSQVRALSLCSIGASRHILWPFFRPFTKQFSRYGLSFSMVGFGRSLIYVGTYPVRQIYYIIFYRNSAVETLGLIHYLLARATLGMCLSLLKGIQDATASIQVFVLQAPESYSRGGKRYDSNSNTRGNDGW